MKLLNKKRILSGTMAFAMIISMISTTGFSSQASNSESKNYFDLLKKERVVTSDFAREFDAMDASKKRVEEAITEGDYQYVVLEDGTAEITDYTGTATALQIPEKIGGKKVTSIGWYVFAECDTLETIIIPDSVKQIKEGAFCNSGLISVTIPDSVTNIEEGAFYGCENLKTVSIGNGVTCIPEYGFGLCALENIVFGKNIKTISFCAFENNFNLKEVIIPQNVVEIESGAFLMMDYYDEGKVSKLESIIFPESLEKVGTFAFEGTAWYENQPDGSVYAGKVYYGYKGDMPNNTTIEIKPGTKGIAGGAFFIMDDISFERMENKNIKSIIIPDSVTNIGELAFYGCTSLKEIVIPSSVTEIDAYAIGYQEYNDSMEVDMPEDVVAETVWVCPIKMDDVTIHGALGSEADRYAQEYKVDFVVNSVAIATPKLEEISSDYDSITVSWQPVMRATGYQVWRTADNGATWEYINSTADTKYNDTKVSGGKRYIYSVYAYYVASDGKAYFSKPSTEYLGASLKLDKPTLKNVSMNNGAVNVQWNAVEGATGYQVWRTDDYGATWKYIGTSGTTKYTDKTASADNYCIYSVYAYHICKDGSQVWSKASTEYLGCTPLDKPVMKDVFTNGTTAFVTWNPVKNASGYQVWRTADNGVTWDYIGTSGTTMYADKTLQMGKNCKYSIYAYHYTPTGAATWSLASTEYLGCTPMATPVLKKVSLSGNNVLVEWNQLAGAEGYQVWRTADHGATWEYIGTSGTTSFTDKTTTAGGYYQYSIYAYKHTAAGNVSWSLASTEYLGVQR